MNEEEERKNEREKRLQPFVTEWVNFGRWIFGLTDTNCKVEK
jgi:hypothetical protein